MPVPPVSTGQRRPSDCAIYRSESYATKLERHGGHMAVRQVLVSCRYCQRPVALEATIGNQALPRLQAHLVACQPDVAPRVSASFGEVLRYFRIERTAPDLERSGRRLRVGS